MYTHSRKWVAPSVKEKAERHALNQARKRICPKSPFWTPDFDLKAHKEAMAELLSKHAARKLAYDRAATSNHVESDLPPPEPIRAPLDDQPLTAKTSHSAILAIPTIFCPNFAKDKPDIAPWPGKHEMKYEGDDRIATDRLHRRFPPAPRVEGNETVTWQHRAIIPQWPLDDFYYPVPTEEQLWERGHVVDEFEIDDEEGERLLGKELMALLDPVDEL